MEMQTTGGPALLVDARNAIYRAVYAGLADRSDRPKYHPFVIFLRQIVSWMNSKRPSSVHVFWDAPRATVWRKKILPTYKDRTDSNYVEGLAEGLSVTTDVAKAFFKFMGVRQYDRKEMEADDLIYTAVTLLHPHRSWIVSNDSDMTQIPFRFSSCSVFCPEGLGGEDAPVSDVSPAHLKALMGDKSDSIDGYNQIGPVRGTELLRNPEAMEEFLAVKGSKTYKRNLALIDLAMCPWLLSNTFYVQKMMAQKVAWDKGEVNKLIMEHKVNGLQQEFVNLVQPFKSLI